jgi:hypothetical protein
MNREFVNLLNNHKKRTSIERRKIEGMNHAGYNTYIHGNVTMKLSV